MSYNSFLQGIGVKLTEAVRASWSYLYPLGAGTAAGGVTAEVGDWSNPVAVAGAGSVGVTLLLGLFDRGLRWHRESRKSSVEVAEIMRSERRDLLDRQDQMRLEQRAYYRELISQISNGRIGADSALDAEVKLQTPTQGVIEEPSPFTKY
jgi:hypothetical protein